MPPRLIELVFGTIEFYTVVVVVIIIIIISTPIILTLSFQASFNPPSLQILPTVAFLFTARCYASAVLAVGLCPSVSVSVSVTSRSSTKTAKRRITQTTPHDTPGTLVFGCQRSPRNSTGITPCGGAECRWGGAKSATFDK